MNKHRSTCLTLALIALLHLSSARAARHRQPRSIWPWWSKSSEAEGAGQGAEDLISEKHAEILRQAGYGDYLDLSRHPVWKVHKYEGIDLKPVQLESEAIKSTATGQSAPQVDARNPVSRVAPLTESADDSLPDLSFLDDLGGLAYFLPDADPEDDDDAQENEKASILATTIANEEDSHPGFFAKIWSMIWGSSAADSREKAIEPQMEISLPATRQHYAEISLLKPSTTLVAEPADRASDYAAASSASGAGALQADTVVVQPVAKWYKPDSQFSRTRAYVQSWNPNAAAYSLHVQGPSEYPAEHVAKVHAYTADNFQRKSSEAAEQQEESVVQVVSNRPPVEQIIDQVDIPNNHSRRDAPGPQVEQQVSEAPLPLSESQVQQVAESTTTMSSEQIKRNSLRESIAKVLSMNFLPKLLVNKLKDIDRLLGNDEPSEESMDKLRKLQAELEKRKHQLGSVYPALRKLFPSQF